MWYLFFRGTSASCFVSTLFTDLFERGKERLLVQCGMESSGRDHCGYSNSWLFFLCVYCERVRVFYPLVVTSLEGLQWWSPIIAECTEQP